MRRLAACCLLLALASSPLRAEVPDAAADARVADARDLFMAGDHAAGLHVLVPAADAGHPRAQNIVGAAYQYGNGLPVDAAMAIRMFESAAAQGYPPAIYNLGILYRDGMPGQVPDLPRAREQFRLAAALDYAPALTAQAAMLFSGDGGPVDLDAARRLFDRAGELGDPYAHDWLGWLYRTGGGGYPQDAAAARDHYTIAALHGVPWAQNSLGEMIELGEGGAPDPVAALDWYRDAVAGDHAYAGINAAWAIFDNPDLFPDQVEGLAFCAWAVGAATGADRASYDSACAEIEADFTPEQVRAAEKVAAGL